MDPDTDSDEDTAPRREDSSSSASEFSCSEDDSDESDGAGNFSDASVGAKLARKDPTEESLNRVGRALPTERRNLQRTIERHRRSTRVTRLEAYVKALAEAALRAAPAKEDKEALQTILAAARGLGARWCP